MVKDIEVSPMDLYLVSAELKQLVLVACHQTSKI